MDDARGFDLFIKLWQEIVSAWWEGFSARRIQMGLYLKSNKSSI